MIGDPDARVRAVALWQLWLLPDQRPAAAEYAAGVDTDDLERFVAMAILLAGEPTDRDLASAIVGAADLIYPEFENAMLHHVADSPLDFAVVAAGFESLSDLEAVAAS